MKLGKKILASSAALMAVASTAASTAGAAWADNVSINNGAGANAQTMMNKIIGILLTITRYAGVALCVYGVYEIVMSFMQNQPEQKTKGIIMTLSGAAMVGMKSILGSQGLGIIS